MKDLYDRYGLSSPYGNRSGGFHYGVDIPTPMRQKLYSPEAGTIAFEGRIPAAVKGWPDDIIIILQLAKSFIVFAHLDETVINTGQKVKKGQLLGYTGNSGYSFGPHLHAEERAGIKDPNKGFLSYTSIDITPRFVGAGETMDVKKFLSDFARAVLNAVEDKPNYHEKYPEAFKGHLDWLVVEYAKRGPVALRDFIANTMKGNGILSRKDMDKHLKADSEKAKELREAKRERDEFKKQLETFIAEVNVQEKQCELSHAEKDKQILALQEEINTLKNTRPSEAPRSDENDSDGSRDLENQSNYIQIIVDAIKSLFKGVKF